MWAGGIFPPAHITFRVARMQGYCGPRWLRKLILSAKAWSGKRRRRVARDYLGRCRSSIQGIWGLLRTGHIGKGVARQRFLFHTADSTAVFAADLAFLTARSSLNDFPDFLEMTWRGDLSDITAPGDCGGLLGPDRSTLLPGPSRWAPSHRQLPRCSLDLVGNPASSGMRQLLSAELAEQPLTWDTPVATVRRDCLERCAHFRIHTCSQCAAAPF